MVWGGIECEKISLNEETIWAAPKSPATTLSSEYVYVNQRKRQLAIEGKYDQVRKVTVKNAGIPWTRKSPGKKSAEVIAARSTIRWRISIFTSAPPKRSATTGANPT